MRHDWLFLRSLKNPLPRLRPRPLPKGEVRWRGGEGLTCWRGGLVLGEAEWNTSTTRERVGRCYGGTPLLGRRAGIGRRGLPPRGGVGGRVAGGGRRPPKLPAGRDEPRGNLVKGPGFAWAGEHAVTVSARLDCGLMTNPGQRAQRIREKAGDLPTQYTASEHEGRIWALWERAGAFAADPGRVLSGGDRAYCVLMPPVNVTDRLTI